MKTAIFISVRTKSTRLPKKALLEIKGKTVVEHLIDRLKQIKLADMIVLCTSTNPNDTILVDIAKKNGIQYFRGSEDDVLDRYLKAADAFKVDFLIIALGDAVFTSWEYAEKMIELFRKTNADFIMCNELPIGTFTYGLKVEALKKVCQTKDATETEVWGGYFLAPGMFNVKELKVEEEELRHPEVRLVIDYLEDFELVKEIFNRLYKEGEVFSLKEIMDLFVKKPELLDINKKCQELYKENLKKSTPVKFKN
jgi:spore coat polysaccharide biosynthesis protein SpsF